MSYIVTDEFYEFISTTPEIKAIRPTVNKKTINRILGGTLSNPQIDLNKQRLLKTDIAYIKFTSISSTQLPELISSIVLDITKAAFSTGKEITNFKIHDNYLILSYEEEESELDYIKRVNEQVRYNELISITDFVVEQYERFSDNTTQIIKERLISRINELQKKLNELG